VFEPESSPVRKGLQPIHLILLAAVLVGATVVGYLQWRAGQPIEEPEPVLTEEARAYLSSLELSDDTGMQATEDALGQTLLEITGSVSNHGERTLSLIDVAVVFREINGVEVDRQHAAIVNPRTGPLEPGETQEFRLPFDNVPQDWNQVFPSLYIAQIEFGDR
jgi:hypothetical protein